MVGCGIHVTHFHINISRVFGLLSFLLCGMLGNTMRLNSYSHSQVNGSGQFIGLAEMAGQVDFNKDMDFWQVDKWSGFFPVKWHVIKDIPNTQLRHIILENNDNRPVTFTRDTQEVLLCFLFSIGYIVF